MASPVLLLASRCCSECLMSRGRIVPGDRAAELVEQCRRADVHFICHKASLAGLNVHCRGVHDRFPARSYRFAVHHGIPIQEVDPDAIPKAGGEVPAAQKE